MMHVKRNVRQRMRREKGLGCKLEASKGRIIFLLFGEMGKEVYSRGEEECRESDAIEDSKGDQGSEHRGGEQ